MDGLSTLRNRRIIVFSPQIMENYQLQSGEGLSLSFVYIWLLGDLCNLWGAILARLLPTVIILAIYVSALEYGFPCPSDRFLTVYTLRCRVGFPDILLSVEETV